jgi:hypothetical protein
MDLNFPILGLNQNWANYTQPAQTSPSVSNCRPYDVLETRARGGQRPALRKLYTQQIGGAAARIDALTQVTIAS